MASFKLPFTKTSYGQTNLIDEELDDSHAFYGPIYRRFGVDGAGRLRGPHGGFLYRDEGVLKEDGYGAYDARSTTAQGRTVIAELESTVGASVMEATQRMAAPGVAVVGAYDSTPAPAAASPAASSAPSAITSSPAPAGLVAPASRKSRRPAVLAGAGAAASVLLGLLLRKR